MCLTSASPALAQQAERESVEARPRPEYDPLGIFLDDIMRVVGRADPGSARGPTPDSTETLGSFLVNTTMELETSYDDNVFRKASGKQSDYLARFKPGFDVKSDWSNHALNFSLSADLGRYADLATEDFNDFNTSLSGKIDVDEGEMIDLRITWGLGHQARSSVDDASEPEPTRTQSYGFNAVFNRDVGEIFSRTTVDAARTDIFANGATSNSDRDLWTYTVRQRFGHDVDEGSQLFIEGAGNLRDYDLSVGRNGTKLGSHGFEGLVGLVWDASGVTFAEFGAGYLIQNHNEPSFQASKGPSFRGRFVWNPTGLLTLSGSASREVKETSQANASGVLNTNYTLKFDWEALYNLILSAQMGYTTEDTRGINRIDDTTNFALRARWLLDQRWSLRGAIEFDQRESTSASSEFENMRFTIAITEKL